MAQFLRISKVGPAVAGLSTTQLLLKRRDATVRAETKAQLARKDMENTALWKNYSAKYGADNHKQLQFHDVGGLLKDVGVESEVVVSRLFECMDDDHSGTVSPKEMMGFCQKLGSGDRLAKMRFIFEACDHDSSGKIEACDLRDFVKHMILNCNEKVPDYALLASEQDAKMFKDVPTELVALMKANRLVHEVFKAADADKNGEIDFKEFSFWFQRGDKTVRNFSELFHLFDLLVQE